MGDHPASEMELRFRVTCLESDLAELAIDVRRLVSRVESLEAVQRGPSISAAHQRGELRQVPTVIA